MWLLSDERNDAVLERSLKRLPRRSAFVFRHYHLPDPERYARFEALRRIAKAHGHVVILADSALTAREWGADGVYGAPKALYPSRHTLITAATVHNMKELGQANRFGADFSLISPIFATRSHQNAKTLGSIRFRTLAAYAKMPVIALGGMNLESAHRLQWPAWAAIDGLSAL